MCATYPYTNAEHSFPFSVFVFHAFAYIRMCTGIHCYSLVPPEQENLEKLADAKAEFVSEQFGRIEESVLQLQAFAGQALLAAPETLVVDAYVASVPTLDSGVPEGEETFDYSVW